MPPHRLLPLLVLLLAVSGAAAAGGNATSAPLACSELSRVCTAFLAFPAAGAGAANATLLESMFDAAPGDITADAAAATSAAVASGAPEAAAEEGMV